MNPFASAVSPPRIFDAAQTSLHDLFQAAAGKPRLSQDEIISLLAGPEQTTPEGQHVKQELALKIRSVLDAQRLVSLDAILGLADGLNQMTAGKPMPQSMVRFAGELREFEMPKPLFSSRERTEWTFGLYNNRHTQYEMGTDLIKIIKSPSSHNDLNAARTHLLPFLRDSLVGLNYAYYEPPGAQMVYNNPLFVRSHDFSGEMTMGGEESWKTPALFGRGWTAGGGAHLAGSLADLPYVLAHVEQHFIVPENVQSLIWEDLVPCLVTDSVLPRWWRVTPSELHAVALYQRFGEQLIRKSGADEATRARVMNILSDRLLPQRSDEVKEALRSGRPQEALAHLAPAETFYLGAEFRRMFPADVDQLGESGRELQKLAQSHPEAVSWQRLSEDFGVPHPALAQTYSREILNLKPFPTFLGYSSRLLAESWDSNNLYWARLADEMGYPPVMLNRLIPELTHRMVAKIFATNLEDWPALLRALRETGDEFRLGKIASLPKTSASSSY
jgi:hypothetical protein